MPMVDLRKTEGISYQLRVQIEQGKKLEVEKSVVAKIGNVVFRASDSENGSVFGFTGANVAEGSDILEWVKQQPGVKSASMTIAERVVQVFDWIESEDLHYSLCDGDRKSTRLNSSHVAISYAVFCLKKKKICKITATIAT